MGIQGHVQLGTYSMYIMECIGRSSYSGAMRAPCTHAPWSHAGPMHLVHHGGIERPSGDVVDHVGAGGDRPSRDGRVVGVAGYGDRLEGRIRPHGPEERGGRSFTDDASHGPGGVI